LINFSSTTSYQLLHQGALHADAAVALSKGDMGVVGHDKDHANQPLPLIRGIYCTSIAESLLDILIHPLPQSSALYWAYTLLLK